MHSTIGQVFLTIGAIIVLGWAVLPFVIVKLRSRRKKLTSEQQKRREFTLGQNVWLKDYALTVLPLELVEKYGKDSTYVIAAEEDADEMLRELHPQVLFLRKKRDGMMVIWGPGLGNVKFSGAMIQSTSRRNTTVSALSAVAVRAEQKTALARR